MEDMENYGYTLFRTIPKDQRWGDRTGRKVAEVCIPNDEALMML